VGTVRAADQTFEQENLNYQLPSPQSWGKFILNKKQAIGL